MKTIGQRAFRVLLGASFVVACSNSSGAVGSVADQNTSGTAGSAAPTTGGSASGGAGAAGSGGSSALTSGGAGAGFTAGTGGSSAGSSSADSTGGGGGSLSTGGSVSTGGSDSVRGSVSSGGSASTGGSGGAVNSGPINVLVFNYTQGYAEQSRETSIPPLQTAAAANNINLDLKYAILKGKDGNYLPEGTSDVVAGIEVDLSAFTPGGLDQYDVVFFLNTSGLIFQGADEAVHQQALQDYLEQHRGGFVGTHSAADTYTQRWPWYRDFIGALFYGESGVVPGSARWKTGVMHPILTSAAVPNPWSHIDVWYNFTRDVSSLPGFTVLLVGSEGNGTERQSAWVHELSGGGRMFYTAFGQTVDTFKDPAFLTFLMTGIKWAAHRL